jgi:hypothetical protein
MRKVTFHLQSLDVLSLIWLYLVLGALALANFTQEKNPLFLILGIISGIVAWKASIVWSNNYYEFCFPWTIKGQPILKHATGSSNEYIALTNIRSFQVVKAKGSRWLDYGHLILYFTNGEAVKLSNLRRVSKVTNLLAMTLIAGMGGELQNMADKG